MKKTISAVIAATMTFVMSVTSFAAPSVPDFIPGGDLTFIDTILNILDVILGWIGSFAGLLFK